MSIPSGLYTLGELSQKLVEGDDQFPYPATEADRMFALRLDGVGRVGAWKAIGTAAGDLSYSEIERDGKRQHVLTVDAGERRKYKELADRVFSELKSDLLSKIELVHPLASSFIGMPLDEQRNSERMLIDEYNVLSEQLKADPTNRGLQSRIREISASLMAAVFARSDWTTFPIEALWAVRGTMPAHFQDINGWEYRFSRSPGGASRLAELQKLAPKGTDLRDAVIDYSFDFGSADIVLSENVIPLQASEAPVFPASMSGRIELRACNRPTFADHFAQRCAHFGFGPDTTKRETIVPEVANRRVTFTQIGMSVEGLSRAALLWADAAKANIVCELVPYAEQLSHEVVEGEAASLADLIKETDRWTLTEQEAILTLDCTTRAFDTYKVPLLQARDSGLLNWRTTKHEWEYGPETVIKYGRTALAFGSPWNVRSRYVPALDYYGLDPRALDFDAMNVGLADSLGLLSDPANPRQGTFEMKNANPGKVAAVMRLLSKTRSRPQARHPATAEQLLSDALWIGPIVARPRVGIFLVGKTGNPLRLSFGAAYFRPPIKP